MTFAVRRLTPDDTALLLALMRDAAAYELDDDPDDPATTPHTTATARQYLAHPATLHWVAVSADELPVGMLYGVWLPTPNDAAGELLLHGIGVRTNWRRRGVGRALLAALGDWMQAHGVAVVWLLADNPEAVQFYRACGFVVGAGQATYMLRGGGA